MKVRIPSLCRFIFLAFPILIAPMASAQDFKNQTDEFANCATRNDLAESAFNSSARFDAPNIAFFKNAAVILEYNSTDDVHTVWDSLNYPDKRQQPGHFDWDRILQDLEAVIDPANYSFVALYTVNEVTGWIWNGSTTGAPAKNIGMLNSLYNGQPPWNVVGARANWKNLREIPHMNSVDFLVSQDPNLPNANSTLTLFHEIDHYWGVKITAQSSVGPREWNPATDPVAWLASCCSHWSWVWEEAGMPGIMYSGPTSNKFNAFDLYFMGLMGYNEAKSYTHQVYEEPRSEPPVLHDVNLDSLIYALSLAGSGFYEGNGRRIPDLDATAQNLRTLLVIVKGLNEEFSPEQRALVEQMATDIPNDWQIATWGRSNMTTGIDKNNKTGRPYQVVLAQPGNNYFVPEDVVYLEWDASPFATSYHLQVSEKVDFSSVAYEASLFGTTHTDVPNLAEGVDYHWRVQASNGSENGPWSETRTFVRGALIFMPGILVETTADTGAGSLREAIDFANFYAGPDTIRFAIPFTDPGYHAEDGAWTIAPETPLPVLTDDSLVIDGLSQSGFAGGDTNPDGPEIVIDGSQSQENYWGLRIFSAANSISNLVIHNFTNGSAIELIDTTAQFNIVQSCYLGTTPDGMQAAPNLHAVYIDRARRNTIGATLISGGNLISGNSHDGIQIFGESAAENVVSGNFIGTNRKGDAALPNESMGIALYGGTHDNKIGGREPGEGNVISGNKNDGMRIGGDNNLIYGNFVGSDSSGTIAVGNGWDGIGIWQGEGNKIGGSDPGAGNLVSANGTLGIYVRSKHNTVAGNWVGTEITGTAGLGNAQFSGIGAGSGAQNNTIGPGNIVAFNGWGVQVWADSSIQNTITQNSIFSNETFGIIIRDGGNLELPAPVLTDYDGGVLYGTSFAGAIIEVFSDAAEQGQYYEGQTTADAGGNFSFAGVPRGQYFTATATDANGNTSAFSQPLQATAVSADDASLPAEFALQQNFPNPFNPETTIPFSLPHAEIVKLQIFDLLGNEIATLVNEKMQAGDYRIVFRAENLSSGVYFYRLQAGRFIQTRKMILLY